MINMLLSPLLEPRNLRGRGSCMGRAFAVLRPSSLNLISKLLKCLFWGVGPGGPVKRAVLSQVDHSVPSLVDNRLADPL